MRCGMRAPAILLLGIAALAGCTSRPPDVLLIVVDTLRADHLPLHGYARDTAPNLTRLARDAVVYEHAVSPGTWTVPSHGSMLTGQWPSFHGAERVSGDRILARTVSPDVAMLPEILREHGYRTAAFVGNSTYVSSVFGFQRGFDDFVTGNFWHADNVTPALKKWLTRERTPQFLLWNIIDPHEPYDPPPPFDGTFPGRRPEYGTMATERARDHQPMTPEVIAHFESQYDGEIALADREIGAVLDTLKGKHRYDDALVIVTADHGEMFGEHDLFGHGTFPYEPLVHVPLVVKYPGNRDAGRRVARHVSTTAIFGTILRAAGLPAPPGEDPPLLEREHAVWVEDVDFLGNRVRAGYAGSRKLVVRLGGKGEETFLYDLDADPGESNPAREPGGAPPLEAAMRDFGARVRPANRGALPVIDPEHEARLRALGYVR